MTLPIRATRVAESHIREIDKWWRANRSAAPDLFLNELTAAFELIADAPKIGRSYRRSSAQGIRRLLLRKCLYHIYYTPQRGEIRVLAVWHAQRGVGPPLR